MNEDAGEQAYRAALAAAAAFIRDGDGFLVVSHLSPDGDAISSTSAVGLILQSLGKSYTLINEGRIPEKYVGLLGGQPISDYGLQPPDMPFSRIISVDCADFLRIGEVNRLFARNALLLNIDHHPTNNFFGTHHIIKSSAAATVEIIFDLSEVLQVRWTPELASCIYAGLLTDTGGFRYSNTTPTVLSIAERMLRYGAPGAALAEQLLETMSYVQVQLLKEALATLTFSENRKIAWVSVTTDTLSRVGAAEDDTEGLVNIPRNVAGVEVGMLFKQKSDNTVKVSLRSAGRVDVARLAQSMGGGGHVRAAGCTVYGSLDEAVRQLVEAVKSEL